jgi:hypothetical protein
MGVRRTGDDAFDATCVHAIYVLAPLVGFLAGALAIALCCVCRYRRRLRLARLAGDTPRRAGEETMSPVPPLRIVDLELREETTTRRDGIDLYRGY